MTDSSNGPTPPEGLPDQLVSDLAGLSPDELRKTIVHARELLQFHEESEFPVEPEPGDDILRVTEHDGYTEVVKQVHCNEGCENCPHGPFLYHVTKEPQPDGDTRTHWSFIGEARVEED
ncbi:hypothetical protein [Salinibaculum rarum]|uniref:hypothetical protein n=1 Tax=Salinibaculum rarum TaxID=3058903 RepID=UPI00265F4A57|nr:hypothetical protein [Salinibaculum sp. KK48]